MSFKEKSSAWKGPFSRATTRLATSTRQTDLALPGTPPPIELEVPISQLPLAGALFGDEMVPLVQNGITCRSTAAIVSGSGQAPVYINKTVTLVYVATAGQTIFSLNTMDHYGNVYLLTGLEALQVTVGGDRFIQDDGTGIGQYNVNLHSNFVMFLTPIAAGTVVVFDIFGLSNPAITLHTNQSLLRTQALAITTPNIFPTLLFPPNGEMTIVYVNGRAFSDDAMPPSFMVAGSTINWIDPVYSVVPGDIVVVAYTSGPPVGGVVPSSAAFTTEALTVTAPNTLAPLTHFADGGAFILVVDGTSFVAVGASAAFHYSGRTVTWASTTFNIGTGSNVSATYSYIAGT